MPGDPVTTRRAWLFGMAALAVPAALRAQPASGARIAWISYTNPGAALRAFEESIRALGYTGSKQLAIELRIVEHPDRVRSVVEELQKLPVALIVAQAAVVPPAHRAIAGRLPLVFAFSGDPVVAGLVDSLAHPGGNTTGMSFLALELVGKRIEVLKDIAPAMRRVAIVANPQHPGEKSELRASVEAAERAGIETAYIPLLPGESPEAAFARIRKERVQGLVVFPDSGMVSRAPAIAEFAMQERLLAVSGWAEFARAGFIATYGPSLIDVYRRLAVYVDRLLRGARADSLPVELPRRIELVLNQGTARRVGVTLPRAVTTRADEIVG